MPLSWMIRMCGLVVIMRLGSASPVLTATGFVTGRGQFLTPTPTVSTPLDRLPKNLLLVIMSATLWLCQIWCKSVHRGLLAKWVKYNENFICLFIYIFFSWTHLQVRPVDGFSRLMAQTTGQRRVVLEWARMCLLGVSLILLLILGVKYSQNPNFRGE